ncbi:hypothetical protein AC578_9353 [Pseudocercospora eumusae]|uniref:Uncharacterized protein n=1 Tax=Pseudocercospora eumusae TaxID=321146 RepID=A0A139GW93_9PEZI|nr:hypothetical protein AC578_9353 [Pseudocercospora eumusae]
MALADLSLLLILIIAIPTTKILISYYHRPMHEADQYKTLCLLLLMHIYAILGSISLPGDDTPIFRGSLGSLWSLRYVIAFFLAWVLESFWIVIGLRYGEDIRCPASVFILTEICLWAWVLRIDDDRDVAWVEESTEQHEISKVLVRLGGIFVAGLGCLLVACVVDRMFWRKMDRGRRERELVQGDERCYGTMGFSGRDCDLDEDYGKLRDGGRRLGQTARTATQDICSRV